MEPIGLYIHVPFCLSKCPYCDFYSYAASDEAMDAYTAAVERALADWAARIGVPADTLYIGGGTPSLLGGARLARLVEAARRGFGLRDAEITLEANPADDLAETLRAFAAAGGSRLSLGMQSAEPDELRLLGRRHTTADVERAVRAAVRAGLDNLSLDMMLGLPGQTMDSWKATVEHALSLIPQHLSCYGLSAEDRAGHPLCRPGAVSAGRGRRGRFVSGRRRGAGSPGLRPV